MYLTVLCTLCFVLCELYIKICLPGQYKYWPDVALLMAANGRGHSAASFQLGLTVSASVVDKDCGDQNTKMFGGNRRKGTEVGSRRKKRSWQWLGCAVNCIRAVV